MKRSEVERARAKAGAMLANAGIAITPQERETMEVIDLGLGEFEKTGLALVVYENNERYCAKELILLPRQTCPEHRHPPLSADPGKMETFRCRWGKVWIYSTGEAVARPKAKVPAGSEPYYTVFHEVELNPGGQYTIPSDTWHWFQAGDEGCIVSEFSSTSRDELDVFTDPRIDRTPRIEGG
jgi:D-lyxose ketol-isomerase